MIMQEDKATLTHRRVELIGSLAGTLSTEDRVRIQGELSVINAKIKGLNTTQAAQLKATADQRKVAGLAEAQANATRARARAQVNTDSEDNPGSRDAHGTWHPPEDTDDDDPGQTAVIDAWIDAVLLRHDVNFTRSPTGELTIFGATARVPRAPVLKMLTAAIYAAARGQELPELLPELPPLPPPPPPPRKVPKPPKTKKR